MRARSSIVSALLLAVACRSASPPVGARQAAPNFPSSRDELLKVIFAAVAANDPSPLTRLGEPEADWKATLECPPPGPSELDQQRSRFATLVEMTKGLRVQLVNVVEDTVLADVPQGYDDGYGCKTKVALRFHRLVLKLRIVTATGSSRPGKWTLQVQEYDGKWHLTTDILRIDLGTEPS